jgi:hypothetical protein
MTDEKDLGKALLKRNGIEEGKEFRDSLREVAAVTERDRIARDKARARRATIVAVVSIAVLMVMYFGRKGLVTRGLLDSLIVDMGIFVVTALCILALAVAVPIWIGTSSPGDGIAPGEGPEKRRAELYRMVERDKVRARGAKFGAVFGCVAAWASVVVIGIVRGGLDSKEVVLLLFAGFCFCAVFLPLGLWFIGMYFGQRQIQTSLADIAEQLRQLATDQQAERSKAGGQPGRESGSETKRD